MSNLLTKQSKRDKKGGGSEVEEVTIDKFASDPAALTAHSDRVTSEQMDALRKVRDFDPEDKQSEGYKYLLSSGELGGSTSSEILEEAIPTQLQNPPPEVTTPKIPASQKMKQVADLPPKEPITVTIPAGYPGEGQPLPEELEGQWPAIKAQIDLLPLMDLADLKNVGPSVFSTDHGEIPWTVPTTILNRMAALYYSNLEQAPVNEQVMKNIIGCYQVLGLGQDTSSLDDKGEFMQLLEDNGVLYWAISVGVLLFDQATLCDPANLTSFTYDDYEAAVNQLESHSEDARTLLNVLTRLSTHKPDCFFPVPSYMRFSSLLDVYLTKFCVGDRPGYGIPYTVIPKTDYPLELKEQKKSDETDEEVSSVGSIEDTEDLGLDEAARIAEAKDPLNVKFGKKHIDLSKEAMKGLGKVRDTTGFRNEVLVVKELTKKLDAMTAQNLELKKIITQQDAKMDVVLARTSDMESFLKQELAEVNRSLGILIAQKSYTDLGDQTEKNKKVFAQAGESSDPSRNKKMFTSGGIPPTIPKAPTSSPATQRTLKERLTDFSPADMDSLVKDLKVFFVKVRQPSLAENVNDKILAKPDVRFRLANTVVKYGG